LHLATKMRLKCKPQRVAKFGSPKHTAESATAENGAVQTELQEQVAALEEAVLAEVGNKVAAKD
jgi:hypothetical protein